MVSIGVQVNIVDDINIKKKAERVRIASAKYKQKLIDENRYYKRLEYFKEKNYMKRHYYKKPDEFLECVNFFYRYIKN